MKRMGLQRKESEWSFFCGATPNSGLGRLIIDVSRSHIQLVGHLWESYRPVATYTTHRAQETNSATLSGTRTRNPSNQAGSDFRLRPHGHRDGRHLVLFSWRVLLYFLHNYRKKERKKCTALFWTLPPSITAQEWTKIAKSKLTKFPWHMCVWHAWFSATPGVRYESSSNRS